LIIALYLDYCSLRLRLLQARLIQREIPVGQRSECLRFIPAQILPAVLGESVHEERQFASSKQQDRAESAGSAVPLAGDALLDDTAAEISIDQAPSRSSHSLTQVGIIHPLTGGEAGERLGLENLHHELRERFQLRTH